MSDSKPVKTLTLKPKPRPEDDGNNGSARKRAGARARQAVQAERIRAQQERMRERDQERARLERQATPTSPRARPRTQSSLRPGQNDPRGQLFTVYAPCPQGLEEALASELEALGYDEVEMGRAGCRFRSDWIGIMRANLYSRLATRILVQLNHGPVQTEDDILELAQRTPWEQWFGPEHTLRVDTSAIRSPMQSLQYCNLRAKDGICDRLRDKEGARPDIDTVRPDARVQLFLDQTSATLYLDTSGESLFKRGWRLDKGEAPLRENLASGLLALSGWDPQKPLFDPFCGSGTILIEAAWIALGVPPGIWRPFGFQRLRDHNDRVWKDLKTEARARIAPRLDTPIVGADINPAALDAVRHNLNRAHLTPETIQLQAGDARHMVPPTEPGWIVSNPPYGERMAEDDTLWQDWASNLKQHYDGWSLNVISSNLELPRSLRLKALRRRPLYNGALECRLYSFDIVSDSYRKK